MKKIRYIVLLMVVLSAFSIAAASGKQPTGQQIDMLYGPETVTLEAGEPFYVSNGYSCGYCKQVKDFPELGLWGYKCGAGLVPFTLALDGEEIHFSYFESLPGKFSLIGEDGVEYFFKMKFYMWTFNFPDGLDPGTYVLTGTWHNICENVYDDCEKPLERIIVLEKIVTLIVE